MSFNVTNMTYPEYRDGAWRLSISMTNILISAGVEYQDIVAALLKGVEASSALCDPHMATFNQWLEDHACTWDKNKWGHYEVEFPSQDIAALFRLTFYR